MTDFSIEAYVYLEPHQNSQSDDDVAEGKNMADMPSLSKHSKPSSETAVPDNASGQSLGVTNVAFDSQEESQTGRDEKQSKDSSGMSSTTHAVLA